MIYLDYNATTPVHQDVLEAMLPYFSKNFANPASRTHQPGKDVHKMMSKCRSQLASLFQLEARYVIFTSGATEANNLVILGIKNHLQKINRMKIITASFEHKSVLDPLDHLAENGFEVIYIKPNKKGYVSIEQFAKYIDEKTGLVSLMHVNNELGTVQPIEEVAKLAKKAGSYMHVDGVQGFCKVSTSLDQTIDYYTASAHKIYGPKGIGCLFINGRKARKPLKPIVFGGGHEEGLRSGTLPAPLVVGFAKATEICKKLYSPSNKKNFLSTLVLIKKGLERSPFIQPNVDIEKKLPTTLNFRIKNIKSEALLLRLKGLALSNGSACTSYDYKPSHVLKSIGLTDKEALCSIRLSLGYGISNKDVPEIIHVINQMIAL